MARYTDTQEIAFPENRDSRGIVVNGEMEIYVFDGQDYILADTLTAGSYQYFTRGMSFRFTPLSGSYYIEEGVTR